MTPRKPPANPNPLSAIVVAGTHSGVGKTTITLGLIGALRRRGLVVQPFKVGPDFIDPMHHAHASGRPSLNLDGWMLTPETNRERFARATADADIAVVEGVMGLFDGSEGKSDRGSTAEMAKVLGLPVILVIDPSAMARSAAAVINGFATFDPELRIAGVILNNVSGDVHAQIIRDAVGDMVPVVGAIPRSADLRVPERHLGLLLPNEATDDYYQRAADAVESNVDVGRLVAASEIGRPLAPAVRASTPIKVRIGVARDDAFCFYYADNLELLERAGAELVPFSPLADPPPLGVDGLYFGGGYPELHAEKLSANIASRAAVKAFADTGGPIYAECGGLMYLAEELRVDGQPYAMCGALPFATMIPAGLKIAYVDVHTTGGLFGAGQKVRGHIFHHSELLGDPTAERVFELMNTRGEPSMEGYQSGSVLASYVHLHFASQPGLAAAFVERCAKFSDR